MVTFEQFVARLRQKYKRHPDQLQALERLQKQGHTVLEQGAWMDQFAACLQLVRQGK